MRMGRSLKGRRDSSLSRSRMRNSRVVDYYGSYCRGGRELCGGEASRARRRAASSAGSLPKAGVRGKAGRKSAAGLSLSRLHSMQLDDEVAVGGCSQQRRLRHDVVQATAHLA